MTRTNSIGYLIMYVWLVFLKLVQQIQRALPITSQTVLMYSIVYNGYNIGVD